MSVVWLRMFPAIIGSFFHQEKGNGLMIEDLLGAAPARQVRKDADVYGASGMQ